MKGLGIGLLIIGLIMLIFTNINYTTEEKVIDVGPLELDKEEEHSIGWPTYVGGLVLLAGVGVIVMSRKK